MNNFRNSLALTFLFACVPAFAWSPPTTYGKNGVKYVGGIPSCSYGNLRSCGAAAAQNSPTATQYMNQRIANNPNPNKTTFYNYNPPVKAVVSNPAPKYVAPVQNVVKAPVSKYNPPAKAPVNTVKSNSATTNYKPSCSQVYSGTSAAIQAQKRAMNFCS
jgi:hypothetical protein